MPLRLHVFCDHPDPLADAVTQALGTRPGPRLAALSTPAPKERRKLWDLPSTLHCSIVGTCFSTLELRSLVGKLTGQDVGAKSDLEIHESAVALSSRRDSARVMHKSLDRLYQATLSRFDKARDAASLARFWEEAKRAGDIPGAYWATLTHRDVNHEITQAAFGDVHMLSHLVGSANRADIRRLTVLESEHGVLANKLADLDERYRELQARSTDDQRKLNDRIAELSAELAARRQRDGAAGASRSHGALADRIEQLERRLGVETARRELAEQRCTVAERVAAQHATTIETLTAREVALATELALLESTPSMDADATADSTGPRLDGETVLYVGGRPVLIPRFRAYVQRAGGLFLHHDGGMEDRRTLMASAVARADWVYFPVDCVSHDAALALKRLCHQMDKPFFALRSSGLGSFLVALGDRLPAEGEPCLP